MLSFICSLNAFQRGTCGCGWATPTPWCWCWTSWQLWSKSTFHGLLERYISTFEHWFNGDILWFDLIWFDLIWFTLENIWMQKLFVSGMLNYIIDYNYFILVWQGEFSYGNLEPMLAVVSMIYGVATRACLAMWALVISLHLTARLILLDHYLGQITTLVTIVICSLLTQWIFVDHYFGCLFCQFGAQPFPPLIGSGSCYCNVSGQVSFTTEVPSVWQCWLVTTCRVVSYTQGCHGTSLLYLVFSWGADQPLMAPVAELINCRWVSVLLFTSSFFF